MSDIIVLDLGTTRIKAGLFSDGALRDIHSLPAPELIGENGIRISNPRSWLEVADALLANYPKNLPLALASQRSSFLLWTRSGHNPVTPLLSWQDLRAAPWTRRNRHLEDWAATGLPLSPHYAGPKLAMLLEAPELPAPVESLQFGTLDSWLIKNWTHGERHVTGLSLAARTLLLDLDAKDWSPTRLRDFGVPRSIMPEIVDHLSQGIATKEGYLIKSILADQAAGTVPLFQRYPNSAYVNTGTGTFVMRCGRGHAPVGFQTARVGATALGPNTLLWEGAINGGVAHFHGPPMNFFQGISPDLMAVGDTAGLGAPYWRDDLSGYCTQQVQRLSEEDRRVVFAQALLFRIRQVIDGLFEDGPPERVLLAGGLAGREEFVTGLACLLPCPLFILENHEMGLWGAGWQAAGNADPPDIPIKAAPIVRPNPEWEDRYAKWKQWLEKLCAEKAPTGESVWQPGSNQI